MPTPSQTPTPQPNRLAAMAANRPRIKIQIPPPNPQGNYFDAKSPFLSTAHSNQTHLGSGAPQWPPSSPYVSPFSPDKDSLTAGEFMFKQFGGIKDLTWDWTKSGLNHGEKSVFYIYEKISKWSRKWFTHFFLMSIVAMYTIAGASIFIYFEGPAQENSTAVFNNLKKDFSLKMFEVSTSEELRKNFTRWEQIVIHEINELQTDLITLYKLGYFDDEQYLHDEIAQDRREKRRKWSFWNAMFYCGTIYTTIGYGHISCTTNTGRAITILYAIIGIPLFLILLADFGKLFTRGIKFIWSYVRRLYYTGSMRRVRKQAQVQEMIRGMSIAYDIATFRRPSMMAKESDLERAQTATPTAGTYSESPTTPMPPEMEIDDEFNLPISLAFFILILYILAGAGVYSIWENWTFFESCYFVFVSMSTIGFGDYVPQHPARMMASIIYLIFGLALTSMCINVVQVKLNDSFRHASAKIGATIGLTLAEEEARSSQNLTPVPENASVHSYGKNSDKVDSKHSIDSGNYDNAEFRDGKVLQVSDPKQQPLLQKSADNIDVNNKTKHI